MTLKLADIRDNKEYYEGKTSDLVRQLSFAGLGLIWILKDVNNMLPRMLILAAIFIIITLFLDILQYIASSVIWGRVFRAYDRSNKQLDDECKVYSLVNTLGYVCFWAKVMSLTISYVTVFRFLYERFNI